jgi:threonyl-tRNA synthetase
MQQWPDFIQQRIVLFDRLMKEYKDEVAKKPRSPIKITLSDGKVVDGKAWETTPFNVAKGISNSLAKEVVIAKVNDELWDLNRPLEGDASVKFLKFDDDEGKQVFWHSSAHVLGEACERYNGCHLCYGPPISDGFYYDMFTG